MEKAIQEPAGFNPEELLLQAHQVILPEPNGNKPASLNLKVQAVKVGVDLGTAYTVLVVLDKHGQPIAGEYRFTQVVRDGLVVDYFGAVNTLQAMKRNVEARLGLTLDHAASGYPPGVPSAEVRATAHVIQAAGMDCRDLIDEPTAANLVLGIQNGVIVDIGGGTTGIAVIENSEVVYTADEATGGTHFNLVIAGGADISFEEAEVLKKDPSEQSRLVPLIRPVMEKMGTIIARHILGRDVKSIILVGGTTLFPGIAGVIQEVTGVPTEVPNHPLFVTPLGIAMHDSQGK